MKGYWLEAVDGSLGRIVFAVWVTSEEIEQRAYRLLAQHLQQRLSDPARAVIELKLCIRREAIP